MPWPARRRRSEAMKGKRSARMRSGEKRSGEKRSVPTGFPSHRQRQDVLLTGVVWIGDLAPQAALVHDQDAVGHPQDFRQFAADHYHGFAAGGQTVDQLVDLVLRAHVDAAGGLVEDHHPGVALEPPGDQELLLVAARELTRALPGIGDLDAQALRVAGEGEAVKGGRSGDLYLTVRMKRHPKFEREGFDVHSEEELSFPQAALGTKIDVSTLDGDVSLKIPAGTQSGTVMRLRGKGVPFLKRTGRGDHYVTVHVSVPTKLTRQQRKALEGWGE